MVDKKTGQKVSRWLKVRAKGTGQYYLFSDPIWWVVVDFVGLFVRATWGERDEVRGRKGTKEYMAARRSGQR
jgi:hypothetical protein